LATSDLSKFFYFRSLRELLASVRQPSSGETFEQPASHINNDLSRLPPLTLSALVFAFLFDGSCHMLLSVNLFPFAIGALCTDGLTVAKVSTSILWTPEERRRCSKVLLSTFTHFRYFLGVI
jgi:hypothetical protein